MSEQVNQAASNATFEFAALAEATHYRAALIKEFAPYLAGRIIEVGTGIGQFTQLLLQFASLKQLLCVEPDPSFCQALRATFPKQELLQGTLSDVPAESAWDAVLSINVLEHIEDDDRELDICRSLLRRAAGHLCLFVPARREIYAPIDRDFGHYRRYNRPELSAKLRRAGFEIVRLHYFNLAGYFGWLFNFCLLRRRRFAVGAVRCFDRFVFPFTYTLESTLVYPPVGQSLLGVARAVR